MDILKSKRRLFSKWYDVLRSNFRFLENLTHFSKCVLTYRAHIMIWVLQKCLSLFSCLMSSLFHKCFISEVFCYWIILNCASFVHREPERILQQIWRNHRSDGYERPHHAPLQVSTRTIMCKLRSASLGAHQLWLIEPGSRALPASDA